MAQQLINVGTTANDRTGDTWRDAFIKVNANETELFGREADRRVFVNNLSDLPAPVAGIIILASNTQYFQGQDVSIGTNRILMGSNTSYAGIESIVVTLTYTGTGDMFTILNTRNRINNLGISCTTGRVLNFSDNSDSIFRMNDCSIVCDRFGIFNSTGANGSSLRFTTVSPSIISTSGMTFTGTFNTFVWEVSAANITAGDMFDFGTAIFNAIILDLILIDLSIGTNFIVGATGSANIKVGGTAVVSRILAGGAGTRLSGVTTDDIRWIFTNSNDIKDTQPDGLLSLTANATNTVIPAVNTPTLVAGTWVVEQVSLFAGTAAGRLTYTGERDLTTPVDITVDMEPVSGTNKDLKVYLAIDGTVVNPTGRLARIDSGNPVSISVAWQLEASTGSFLEVFVENTTDGIDILVSGAVLRAR